MSNSNKRSLNHWFRFFKRLITIIVIIFIYNNKLLAESKNLLLISHLYPIINDEKKLIKLFDKINSEKVDAVFILGDSSINKEETFLKFKNKIKHKLYFAPGNEEIKNKEKYLDNVGYLDKVIDFENFKILIINSSANIKNIGDFLTSELQKNKKKSNFIFTHFRIWDDALISEGSEQHNKSYYYKDIRPFIKDKATAVFAGDSKRYYFSDIKQQDSFGKQNLNLIYWVDQIDKINYYSIGNGDAFPNINYIILKVDNISGDYKVIPKKIMLEKKDYELVNGRLYNLSIIKVKTNIESIFKLFSNKKFYAGMMVSFLLTVLLITFFYRFFFKK